MVETASEHPPVIAVENVSRRFGYRYVIKNVSLAVSEREVLLLIGHNGAGKTTLMRLMAGLLRPSDGRIERTGSLGMVAHHSMLYDSLSARENLEFFSRLYGGAAGKRIERLLEKIGLTEHADRRVATYSRGMVQRLCLAASLLPDPDLLLLDEPLTGLDDAAAEIVRGILADLLRRNKAIVLATHQIADVIDLASSVGFLADGRMVAVEPVDGRDADSVISRYRAMTRDE